MLDAGLRQNKENKNKSIRINVLILIMLDAGLRRDSENDNRGCISES